MGDVQIEAGYFGCGAGFADFAEGFFQIAGDAVAGARELDFQMGQFGLRLRHLRAHARAEQRQLKRDADFAVIALEVVEELGIVIELGQHAVLRHQVDAGEAGGVGGAHLQSLGDDLRFDLPDLLAGFERGTNGGIFGFGKLRRLAVFAGGTHAVFGRVAEGHRQGAFRVSLIALQLLDGLAETRRRQRGLLLLEGQGASLAHLSLRGGQHALLALLLVAHQGGQTGGPLRVQVERRGPVGDFIVSGFG